MILMILMILACMTASIVKRMTFPSIVTRRYGAPGWKETESRLDHPRVRLVIEAPGWKGCPLRWQGDLVHLVPELRSMNSTRLAEAEQNREHTVTYSY